MCTVTDNDNTLGASRQSWVIAPDEVYVWYCRLDGSPGRVDFLGQHLSKDEHERAGQFRLQTVRDRFIVGRGLLRILLAAYLDQQPGQINFAYGHAGKPALAAGSTTLPLQFNTAHSTDVAIFGFTLNDALGVDVEKIRAFPEAGALAARFFSKQENSALRSLPPSEQCEAFLKLWTCKEAWLKASGEGLSGGLEQVEFCVGSDMPSKLLRIGQNTDTPAQWSLWDLRPEEDWLGAVIVKSRAKRLICRNVTAWR